MPLVIEPKDRKDLKFLQEFLNANSKNCWKMPENMALFLFRGFDIQSDKDFEEAMLSINGLEGISDAFMAERGRDRFDGLKYVLHTNSVL